MSFDPGPPVGYTPTGDMTPFTRFTVTGDVIPFVTNDRGDIVPFAFTNPTITGDPSPWVFDDAGNRIPGVNEMFPGIAGQPPTAPLRGPSAGPASPNVNPALVTQLLLLS